MKCSFRRHIIPWKNHSMMGRNFVNSFLHGILYARFIVNLSSLSLTGRVAKCYRKGGVFWKLCIFATVRGRGGGVRKLAASAFREYPHSIFACLVTKIFPLPVPTSQRTRKIFFGCQLFPSEGSDRARTHISLPYCFSEWKPLWRVRCLVRRKRRKNLRTNG